MNQTQGFSDYLATNTKYVILILYPYLKTIITINIRNLGSIQS